MKRLAAALGAAIIVGIPVGFFLAAQWAAHQSRAEKLAGTGLILTMGLFFMGCAVVGAVCAVDELDGGS